MLLTLRFPLAAPDALGLKTTLNVTLSPGFNVVGTLLPRDANGPETAMALIVTAPVPLFETDTLCAGLELLTVTFPKVKEVTDTASSRSAEGRVTFVLTYPLQAESATKRNN